MLAGEPSISASNDMLIAGLGLGGILFAMSQLSAAVPRGRVPAIPTTALNESFPLLSGVLDLPMVVMMSVAMLGIPLLVVAALSRRWSLRVLMLAGILVLAGAPVWAFTPAIDIAPWTAVLGVVRLAVVSVAIVVWGSLAAWSWVVAALSVFALSGLRLAAYGVVWQERGAGALTLLVAAALIVAITRKVAGPRPTRTAAL
jgi:hypothetical protein